MKPSKRPRQRSLKQPEVLSSKDYAAQNFPDDKSMFEDDAFLQNV